MIFTAKIVVCQKSNAALGNVAKPIKLSILK
jgi:hypothetical protein